MHNIIWVMFTYGPINYVKGTIMQKQFNMRDTCCNDSVSNTLQECYHAIHIFLYYWKLHCQQLPLRTSPTAKIIISNSTREKKKKKSFQKNDREPCLYNSSQFQVYIKGGTNIHVFIKYTRQRYMHILYCYVMNVYYICIHIHIYKYSFF